MYALFNERMVSNRGAVVFPEYQRVRKELYRDLRTTVRYYRNSTDAVEASHLLVRILQSLNVPMTLDLNVYKDRVEDVADDLAQTLKLTSPLSKGHVHHPGPFGGVESNEILLYTCEPISLETLNAKWESLQSVRFLSHPRTDLGFVVPRGRGKAIEPGYSVISIDIPLLACQYRLWREREQRYNADVQKTVMQFVAAYPLANALYSQADVAVFNRYHNLSVGAPVNSFKYRHPFHLADRYRELDRGLTAMAIDSLRRPYDFDSTLQNFTVITPRSYRDIIRLPSFAKTRQVTWALALSRLNTVEYLVWLNAKQGNSANRRYLNDIARGLQELLMDSTLRSALSTPEYRYVLTQIEEKIRAYL